MSRYSSGVGNGGSASANTCGKSKSPSEGNDSSTAGCGNAPTPFSGGAEYTINTAIYLNDVAFVKDRLAADASWVNQSRGAQSVPLRVAARTGRTEICKLLLEHKADPDDFDRGIGYPIMVYAVKHPAIVQLLIEHKANLRRRITWMGGFDGHKILGGEATALHFADGLRLARRSSNGATGRSCRGFIATR